MATVIVSGDGGTSSGSGFQWEKLLPYAALIAGAYLLWPTIQNFLSGFGSTGSSSSSAGISGQPAATGSTSFQGYSASGLSNPAVVTNPGAPAAQQVINLPGNPTPATIVTAGPGTPVSYFPGGQGVISTSRQVSAAEATLITNNLLNSGIANAWWSPVQTITQTTQPGGINSAGSFQSNIPVGTKHCPGPGPGAPTTDTWHYC